MFDSAKEKVDRYIGTYYALQLTGGTQEEYESLINETHPSPIISLDCATLDGYEDFLEAIGEDLSTDPSDYFGKTSHIEDHFRAEGGSLVLYNLDQLGPGETEELAVDEDTHSMGMYLKGFAEQTDAKIALTAEDTERIFLANGDLAGRVQTVDLSEY